MATSTPTKFWELSQVFLSVVQMAFYLINVVKYVEKLDEMGDTLENLAKKHRSRYEEFRNKDPEFYAWYENLPKYSVCESGIRRGKGEAFHKLGNVFRKLSRMNNGYTPLTMVGRVSENTMDLLKVTGLTRALNYNSEQKRDAVDRMAHWKTIVSIPVEREGDYGYFSKPVESMMNSLKANSEGFNSAGAAFGSSLYNFLHSTNQNQINYGPIPTGTTSTYGTRVLIGTGAGR